MKVIKRDGSSVEIDMTQIRKQTIPACEGLENVDYLLLEKDVELGLKDGVTTKQIQSALIRSSSNRVTVDTPDYTYVAARLALYDHYHHIKRLYGKSHTGDVYNHITLFDYIEKYRFIFSDWYTTYTVEEILELDSCIVSSRDKLFDYSGVEVLLNRYLARYNGVIVELPQHMHMAVCMFLMQNEKNNRLQHIKDLYEEVSTLRYVNATPINTNGRLKTGSLISCLLTHIGDTTTSITEAITETAIGSKLGSGFGFDATTIRSMGASIGGQPNRSGGKVPFLKILNDTLLAFDQGGKRSGAGCVFVECWDIDFFDFLDMRKKNGDDRRRAHELFLSINARDVLFERYEADPESSWTLFDPYDEKEFKINPHVFNPNTRVIKVKEIFVAAITAWVENGTPFWHFVDNTNRQHRHKELGIIRQSNLCQEVVMPTDEERTSVCNLGSINMSRFVNYETYRKTLQVALRAVDNAIDLSDYPTFRSKKSQQEFRACGIGQMGEAEYVATHNMEYGSEEHRKFLEEYYYFTKQVLDEASQELAKEKGSCVVDGYRNAYIQAIAPNSTSGIFAGTTNSVEPVYSKAWVEGNKDNEYFMTAPHITRKNKQYYKSAFEIDIFKQLDCSAIRQKYIDMSISTNIHMNSLDLKATTVRDIIFYAWKKGLKTLYYFKTKAVRNIVCEGCEN